MSNDNNVLTTEDLVLFWDGWPSQWAESPFVMEGVEYNCCEQFMMAEKARVFGDQAAALSILATRSPAAQKALGRKVAGFDEKVWNGVCRGIVYCGNLAKFTQNEALGELLMATGDRTIVEASPEDRIWGIGLRPNDPDAQDPAKWRGRNWLGAAIVQVRDELRRREGLPAPVFDRELRGQLVRRAAMRIEEEAQP